MRGTSRKDVIAEDAAPSERDGEGEKARPVRGPLPPKWTGDMKASYLETAQRFPKTIARLAE